MDVMDIALADFGRCQFLDKETEVKLARRAQRGCIKSRNKLVESQAKLAIKIATEFRGQGVPLDELVSVGMLALLAAADGFDPNRGLRFSTYCGTTLRREMIEFIEVHSSVIRMPYGARQHDKERYDALRDKFVHLTRLDVKIEKRGHSERGAYRRDLLADPSDCNPPAMAMRNETIRRVRRVVSRMPPRQRAVLRGIMAGKSIGELAAEMGVSRQRVSHLETRAMYRLAKSFGKKMPREAYGKMYLVCA